jgi:hypothetical protein
LFTANGERGPRVGLALSKSDVGARLIRAFQDADLMRKGGFSIGDLTRLDSGELPLSKIASLYSGDEIETAIKSRLEEIAVEGEELSALRELLHSGAWTGALGGERARKREGQMIAQWKEVVTGARKSQGDEPGLMRKSSRLGSGTDVAVAAGWEMPTSKSMGKVVQLSHSRHPGHTVSVDGETQAWEHRQGAKSVASSRRDASPAQNSASLYAHLCEWHGV